MGDKIVPATAITADAIAKFELMSPISCLTKSLSSAKIKHRKANTRVRVPKQE